MTGLDWLIIAFALLMGVWGYRHGLIVGALTLAGFVGGALLGGRIGPELLPDGSESPYAPALGLIGALLMGGIVAASVEGIARRLRRNYVRAPGAVALDGLGGALLLAALALGLAWMFGAVALNTPGTPEIRQAVQRSTILRELNRALPPSGFILNALNRIDPGLSIPGPQAPVGPPNARIVEDPEVRAASDSVVRVLGTACGLGVAGSGWLATSSLVVTNAHVVAGQDDTTVISRAGVGPLETTPVHYDPASDLAVLRVEGSLGERPLRLADAPEAGTAGAVLGYPENGPLRIEPARIGPTESVLSEDSYGRGPLRRELTTLRARVRGGNSGGPVVSARGRVLTTVFASTSGSGPPGGYGVPGEIVERALSSALRPVDTGPCA